MSSCESCVRNTSERQRERERGEKEMWENSQMLQCVSSHSMWSDFFRRPAASCVLEA